MVPILAWLLLAAAPDTTRAVFEKGPVRVWTDRDDPYDRGDLATTFFRLDEPGYVTALRVDTDGRVQVLFPRTPWDDNYMPADRTFEVTGAPDGHSFAVDDAAGVGYVFVVASPDRFDYRDLARDDFWDYRLISDGGRIRGDPYVALTDLAERIAPDGAYEYDITPYFVERRYDYPRFVCAQCHTHPRDRGWDEYRLACARFRLVIYDDPAYYAYRYDRGRNVVVERPLHPGPRFVFRNAAPGAGYVTRLRGRPDAAERRRARELSAVRPLVEQHRPDDRPARRGERRGERWEDQRGDRDDRQGRKDRRGRRDDEPRSTGRPDLRRRKR